MISTCFLDITFSFVLRCAEAVFETCRPRIGHLERQARADGPRPWGCLRPRATGPDRAPRRGARPRSRERPRRTIRRLLGDDPQGPRRARGGRAASSRTHGGAIVPERNHPELAFDLRERLQQDAEGGDRHPGRIPGARRREHRHGRQHDRARGGSTAPARRAAGASSTVITNGLRHRLGAGRLAGDHRPDARRPRPLGGPLGRRSARRRPVRAGSTSRRRSWARRASPSSPA